MKIIETNIPGILLIQPDVFPDERGYFFESYQLEKYSKLGIDAKFVQDNESMSTENVLRGLHFQAPPYTQGKLVRVVRGSVQDVAVDLRIGSPAYGKWFAHILSAENKTMMWIPEGFAHGFLTLEENTVFQYKCTNYYHKDSERTLLWDDPALNIEWMSRTPLVSEKDQKGSFFKDWKSPFIYQKY